MIAAIPRPFRICLLLAPAMLLGNPAHVSAQGNGLDGLRLSNSWDDPYGGKTQTQEDLKRLFGKVKKGGLDAKAYPKLEIVPGIRYLMPLEEALNVIGGEVESRNGISTPGFPERSLFSVAISGNFGQGFNRMVLVLDTASQVVSVQFLDQSPGGPDRGPGNGMANSQVVLKLSRGWSTYNFVTLNKKSSSKANVQMGIKKIPRKSPAVYQVNCKFSSSGQLKERVRWFVPQPIVDVIHH
ncbi:MAG: hypothetical protein AAGH89_17505, partial [Verrucomicrobiota bacterium]